MHNGSTGYTPFGRSLVSRGVTHIPCSSINYPIDKIFQGHLFWDTMNIVEAGENLW
jgi:hypothetical protein